MKCELGTNRSNRRPSEGESTDEIRYTEHLTVLIFTWSSFSKNFRGLSDSPKVLYKEGIVSLMYKFTSISFPLSNGFQFVAVERMYSLHGYIYEAV
jgi:hypothetical protein